MMMMNKKRTRTAVSKPEPLDYSSSSHRRSGSRTGEYLVPYDEIDPPNVVVAVVLGTPFHNLAHPHSIPPLRKQCQRFPSRGNCVDNDQRWSTHLKKLLQCTTSSNRPSRHLSLRTNQIFRGMLLFLVFISSFHTILMTTMTRNTVAWAWMTTIVPTQRYHLDHTQRQRHGRSPSFITIVRSSSSSSSSSNSFTGTDLQTINGYNRNDDDNSDDINISENYNERSRNDSATENVFHTMPSTHLSNHRNDTNDDNTSLLFQNNKNDIIDTDSFWVTSPEHGQHNLDESYNKNNIDEDDDDVPRLTEHGGYSHTQASRAKISAANKGKVPWNKGMNRTDEVKARIAAGVRAKNRERFLQKLDEMGITEEEYDERKRAERAAKEAEKRARRTENGGYRPTEETKRKISEILKQKFAAGELKPRPVSPVHVRRGFTHSEETRQKISESLRKRWSTDPAYRAKMIDVSNRVNTKDEVRQKISESLRNKWRSDDAFRNDMMSKIAARKRREVNPETGVLEVIHHDEEHRAKISAAMKAKWQEKEYREKTLQSLASRRSASIASNQPKPPKRPPAVPRSPRPVASSKKPKSTMSPTLSSDTVKQKIPKPKAPINIGHGETTKSRPAKIESYDTEEVVLVRPVQPLTTPHKAKKSSLPSFDTLDKSRSKEKDDDDNDDNLMHHSTKVNVVNGGSSINRLVEPLIPSPRMVVQSDPALDENDKDLDLPSDSTLTKKEVKSSPSANSNGNVELLKAERRDLYDLLYGDDDDIDYENIGDVIDDDRDTSSSPAHINEDYDESTITGSTSPTLASIFSRLEDDNLDTFDPYGLDDF